MKVKPLFDQILVKRIEEPEKTKGGIVIPDTAKEKPLQGEVISVGQGKVLESGEQRELDVKPGQKVLFGKWSGTEITIDQQEHLILKEDEVLGIVED